MEQSQQVEYQPPSSNPPPLASKDERMWGLLCHITALSGYVVPFGNIIGPLVIWLIKRDEYALVADQGKEALNFQITVWLAFIACIPLCFIFIGFVLMFVVGIGALILTIIAAVKANEGFRYRYPMTLRLIK